MKKFKIIAVFGIFILSFISHYIYSVFPNVIVSFFFPINESIFEHMKIIFTSTLLYGIIDYLLLNKNNIQYNNFSFQLFFTSLISIVTFLLIYLPIHYLIGENLVVTLIILFITYVIAQIISYYILKLPENTFLNNLAFLLIILVYINFIVLTYTMGKEEFFNGTYSNNYIANN